MAVGGRGLWKTLGNVTMLAVSYSESRLGRFQGRLYGDFVQSAIIKGLPNVRSCIGDLCETLAECSPNGRSHIVQSLAIVLLATLRRDSAVDFGFVLIVMT